MRAKVAAGTLKAALPDEAKREAIAAALANPAFWRPNLTEIAGHLGVSKKLTLAVYREKGLAVRSFAATLTPARFDALWQNCGREGSTFPLHQADRIARHGR